ncbi:alkaline phosphatase [bacterium]|jgi:alkaline phosphatase D|nr:alkaline phosphatase [bacterium]
MNLEELPKALQHEGRLSRRLFLAYAASLSSIPFLSRYASAAPAHSFTSDPFTFGVASGDPDHESVILWTRLAPKPLEPGGGMPKAPVEVHWEIAEDSSFKKIVQSGKINATPELGHSVHIEPRGLKPDHWYSYRFKSGDATSPIGRTRTMPAPGASPDKLRFAVTSCQNFEAGLFTAYQQMAKDKPDLVFHLGDYIYEYASGRNGKVRTHLGPEIESLDQYRIRYAQYRSDKDLQAMHAACPWFVTWDDHEFDNNCAADISEQKNVDTAKFLIRRANAYQAYYEMMPLRTSSLPVGPNMTLYRKGSFGTLAEFFILDTRQYRSDQPNNDRKSPLNAAATNPRNTLLGETQRKWLFDSMSASKGTWNILAQQVMMALADRSSAKAPANYSMDQWPGYAHERAALLKYVRDHKITNPVVLTGDIHSNWANELRIDDFKQEQAIIATEFVTTSLSSGGNGSPTIKGLDEYLGRNPCTKFHNRERGYIMCDVTPKAYTADYKVIDEVLKPGGKTTSRAKFTVEAGTPKIHKA